MSLFMHLVLESHANRKRKVTYILSAMNEQVHKVSGGREKLHVTDHASCIENAKLV